VLPHARLRDSVENRDVEAGRPTRTALQYSRRENTRAEIHVVDASNDNIEHITASKSIGVGLSIQYNA